MPGGGWKAPTSVNALAWAEEDPGGLAVVGCPVILHVMTNTIRGGVRWVALDILSCSHVGVGHGIVDV